MNLKQCLWPQRSTRMQRDPMGWQYVSGPEKHQRALFYGHPSKSQAYVVCVLREIAHPKCCASPLGITVLDSYAHTFSVHQHIRRCSEIREESERWSQFQTYNWDAEGEDSREALCWNKSDSPQTPIGNYSQNSTSAQKKLLRKGFFLSPVISSFSQLRATEWNLRSKILKIERLCSRLIILTRRATLVEFSDRKLCPGSVAILPKTVPWYVGLYKGRFKTTCRFFVCFAEYVTKNTELLVFDWDFTFATRKRDLCWSTPGYIANDMMTTLFWLYKHVRDIPKVCQRTATNLQNVPRKVTPWTNAEEDKQPHAEGARKTVSIFDKEWETPVTNHCILQS